MTKALYEIIKEYSNIPKVKRMFYNKSVNSPYNQYVLSYENGTKPNLCDLKDVFFYWYEVHPLDKEILDVHLAAIIDRKTLGNPLWLYIIGNSGYLKTTLAQMGKDMTEDVFYVDNLTQKSLVSGLKEKNVKTGEMEPVIGIIKNLNGKVLIVKDFTAVLTNKKEHRDALFAQLRNAYDGEYKGAYGTSAEAIGAEATFGFIGVTTSMIDTYSQHQATLGNRCLKIRTVCGDEDEDEFRIRLAEAALENNGLGEQINKEIRDITKRFIEEGIDYDSVIDYTPYIEKLVNLSDFVAYMRHSFSYTVDRSTGEIEVTAMDKPEAPTRLLQQLTKLLTNLTRVRGRDYILEEDYQTVVRVALDTCIPKYRAVMDLFVEEGLNKPQTLVSIAEFMGNTRKTARQYVQRMMYIGILSSIEGGYVVSDLIQKRMLKSGLIDEDSLISMVPEDNIQEEMKIDEVISKSIHTNKQGLENYMMLESEAGAE